MEDVSNVAAGNGSGISQAIERWGTPPNKMITEAHGDWEYLGRLVSNIPDELVLMILKHLVVDSGGVKDLPTVMRLAKPSTCAWSRCAYDYSIWFLACSKFIPGFSFKRDEAGRIPELPQQFPSWMAVFRRNPDLVTMIHKADSLQNLSVLWLPLKHTFFPCHAAAALLCASECIQVDRNNAAIVGHDVNADHNAALALGQKVIPAARTSIRERADALISKGEVPEISGDLTYSDIVAAFAGWAGTEPRFAGAEPEESRKARLKDVSPLVKLVLSTLRRHNSPGDDAKIYNADELMRILAAYWDLRMTVGPFDEQIYPAMAQGMKELPPQHISVAWSWHQAVPAAYASDYFTALAQVTKDNVEGLGEPRTRELMAQHILTVIENETLALSEELKAELRTVRDAVSPPPAVEEVG